VQEREATLHGIREGVVALDPSGRVRLMNDQAHQLLGIPVAPVGSSVGELLPPSRLRDLLAKESERTLTDRIVLVSGRLLVVSRTPVVHNGVDLGSVVTLRDRTELETALRELDDVRSLTDALRAQQHEFSNRMHVLAGLLELGRDTEAMRYAQQINGATAGVAAELERNIADPRLVALLLAKTTVAAERGVTLSVECPNRVVIDEQADAVVSIIGNLVDNAVDAVTSAPGQPAVPAVVTVRLAEGSHDLVIDVADTGPGIPAGSGESIFSDGWSTKATPGGRARGLGLALVRQLVERLGGSVSVREGPGAAFRVSIPRVRDEVRR
jgi:two-component system CitB family sensor kinase